MESIDVSIILPCHNAEKWLDECFTSILSQDFHKHLEVSVYDDCSTDSSIQIIKDWKIKLEDKGVCVAISGHSDGGPKGVGYAKNRAVSQSRGQFLCFLDADDVMHKNRIKLQYQAALDRPNTIVGCQFSREPVGSTERYTKWSNTLSAEQLYAQAYTSHGPTVIMPTWFMSRETFAKVGKFNESGKGTPEDLIFFYEHLKNGGKVFRVDQCLLMYRYHPEAETFSVKKETIWDLRVNMLQEQILSKWDCFTIWNAGKQGRQLYRSLTKENQNKVTCFCDVDVKKISKGFYVYEDSSERPKPKVPIVHFSDARPPFVICMKQDLTGGGFERNLCSLDLTEGIDYIHFN